MQVEPLHPIFARAAAPSLQRLRDDRKKAPRRVQPLLSYLEAHLYDTDLDYQQLKRACGIRDNTMPALFHQAVGLPPATYIRDCRMATAARLLADTDFKVWQVSDMVGYSSLQVFGRAFKRWSGASPQAYRKQHQQATPARAARPVATPAERAIDLPESTGRSVFRGNLDRADATRLLGRLVSLYPYPGRALVASATGADGDRSADSLLRPREAERLRADELWHLLRAREPREQRELLRRDLDVATLPALTLLLCERSREEGRLDRGVGVAVASLAVDALRLLPPEAPPRLRRHLQASSWAALGNARRLALDLPGAHAAIVRAESALPEPAAPHVHGQVLGMKAALRWYEQRFDEALALTDRAATIFEDVREPREAARVLNLKGVILFYSGEARHAIVELQRAVRLLGRRDDVFLRHSLHEGLTRAYLATGDLEAAAATLPTVRSTAHRLDSPVQVALLRWLEGSLACASGRREAGVRTLREARERLVEAEAQTYVAEISLELAWIVLEDDRLDEAGALAADALPLFDALRLHREAKSAHQVLVRALTRRELTADAVRRARRSLDRLRRDPTLGLR